jgi:hypothetical protein
MRCVPPPPNKPMKRTLNSSVQISAKPSSTSFFKLDGVGGAIQRRLVTDPLRRKENVDARDELLTITEIAVGLAGFSGVVCLTESALSLRASAL